MIVKLLLKLFGTQIRAHFFSEQSKPGGFEALKFDFIDSKGKKYYQYTDPVDLPVIRYGQLQTHLIELNAMLGSKEIGLITEAIEACLQRMLDDNSPNIRVGEMAKLGHIVEEIKNRQEWLLHPDILFDIMAVVTIREDEDLESDSYDKEIHAQKVEQFTIDSRGGLRGFFYSRGINQYLPQLNISEDEWTKYFKDKKAMIIAMDKTLKKYTSAPGLSLSKEQEKKV